MNDKRDKALEWIEKQIRQTRQALGRAEYKPGVKPEELENLRGKIELLEFISGAVLKADGWISVKDDLPAHVIDSFLVCYDDGFVGIADWSHDLWKNDWWFYTDGEYDIDGITHWMPLPEAPKEE